METLLKNALIEEATVTFVFNNSSRTLHVHIEPESDNLLFDNEQEIKKENKAQVIAQIVMIKNLDFLNELRGCDYNELLDIRSSLSNKK